MDPQNPGETGRDGLSCAVCEGSVPSGAIRLLARREGLAFLQLECPSCASTTLAFVVREPDPEPPVDADDLLDMHVLLRDWHGGLRELLDTRVPSDPTP